MHNVDKSLLIAHKPFDIVTDKDNNVGMISEVSINECQPEGHQLGYSVTWLVFKDRQPYTSWYGHSELTVHCNMFVKIGENSCHPMGSNAKYVNKLIV